MVERGYTLLEAIERIPGHNEIGELKADHLAKWITSVRHSCAELGRADIADTYIGGLLSHAPVGQDGVWPCEPVRDVMEDIQSESLMSGAHRGVYNSRGVHPRGEGGNQERQLAEKYRNRAKRFRYHTRSSHRGYSWIWREHTITRRAARMLTLASGDVCTERCIM